jgi:hypothetical protein
MQRRLVLPTVATAVVAALSLGLLSACGSSNQASPTPTASRLPANTELAAIAFNQAEATNDFIVRVTTTSTAPSAGPSLDMCGYNFTTEADRVARRRTAVFTQAHLAPTGIYSEAVEYKTQADAILAMNQFRAAVNGCKNGSVHPSTLAPSSDGKLKFHVVTKDDKDSQFPEADNSGAFVDVTDASGKLTTYLFIYQRYANVIVGMIAARQYVKNLPTDAITFTEDASTLVGGRMAAVITNPQAYASAASVAAGQ